MNRNTIKKPWRTILLVTASLAITFIVASYAFAWYFTAPKRATVIMDAALIDVLPERVTFTTDDSLTLRGWYMPSPNVNAPVMILLHGYTGNRSQMTGNAKLLYEAGYGVLLYDARGCGESDGDVISMGYYEAADLVAAVRFLEQRGVRDIGCLGVSQGGATIALAAKRLSRLKCAILESTYDDMEHAIDHRFEHYLGVPGWLGASLMISMAESRLGCSVGTIAPVEHIAELQCPVLIMGGSADTRVWPEDTRRLFAAAREPKSLWFVPGADHVDLESFAPEQYRAHVLDFLKRYLPLR